MLASWKYIQTTIDARYGEVEVYQAPTGENVCLITRTSNQRVDPSPPQLKIKHDNIVYLHHYEVVDSSDICNKSVKINIIYEYLSNDLLKSIQFRAKQRAQFSEDQIWQIISSILSGLQCLKSYGIAHQNMTPDNILIDNKGRIKLFDSQLLCKSSAYLQVLMNIRDEMYLSPEQLEGITQRKPNHNYDREKSDLFSLGLCIIHTATLQDVKEICQRNILQICFTKLGLVLQNIQYIHGYSLVLVQFLQRILEKDPLRRPTFSQALTYIQRNKVNVDTSILNFKSQRGFSTEVTNTSSTLQPQDTSRQHTSPKLNYLNISDDRMSRISHQQPIPTPQKSTIMSKQPSQLNHQAEYYYSNYRTQLNPTQQLPSTYSPHAQTGQKQNQYLSPFVSEEKQKQIPQKASFQQNGSRQQENTSINTLQRQLSDPNDFQTPILKKTYALHQPRVYQLNHKPLNFQLLQPSNHSYKQSQTSIYNTDRNPREPKPRIDDAYIERIIKEAQKQVEKCKSVKDTPTYRQTQF